MTKEILKGRALVAALHRKFVPHETGPSRVRAALAKRLGYSGIQLWNWQSRNARVSANQIANLVTKAQHVAQSNPIQPIIEFFDFTATDESDKEKNKGRKYKKFRLFNSDNTYELGIERVLKGACGIYIFYDSRGRALYVGKAARQNLWNEIHNALNRSRDVQRVKRVKHPVRRVKFRSSDEKKRQIVPTALKLHELAAFVSAYKVADAAIGVFEAVLVRSFANDLLNVRMEQFSLRRKGKKKKRRGF